MSIIVENLERVRCDVEKVTGRHVELMAVSKSQSADLVRIAFASGQTYFGENYVEELEQKSAALTDLQGLRWSFIGQLQSNKIQRIVRVAHEIQTICSEKHARYVQRYAEEFHKAPFPVFIVLNAAEESTKQGVSFADVRRLADFIEQQCPALSLQGVMAIPPASYSDQAYVPKIPNLYLQIAQIAKTVGKGRLSLGMSGDLKIAIAAGSDIVRIGTAIFGIRRTN